MALFELGLYGLLKFRLRIACARELANLRKIVCEAKLKRPA